MNWNWISFLSCWKRGWHRAQSGYPSLAIALVLLAFLGTTQDLKAHYGLKPLTDEHIQHMETHWSKVVEVKPNKLGALRIQKHLKEHGQPPIDVSVAQTHEEEITTNKTLNKVAAVKAKTLPLPSHVDNSTLPSFPPIGDQGPEGSCVAWATTYYQATHEIGFLDGKNNKTSFTNVLSPKWTYNLLNQGQDGGLIITDPYSLLSQNGAVSIANFPYDANYLGWDLNAQDWISAISNRTGTAQMIGMLNIQGSAALPTIKQLLNNGHVVTFGTYIDSWVFTSVGQDPSAPSPYAGQYAASWMNGTSGGHCMTIVGYDDTVWIDVNGNGVVDSGEKGAFLVANSWGTNWGNNGFVWISYDAFLQTSAVPNGPNNGRVPAGDALDSNVVSVLPISANYSPSLVGQFSISQSQRDQFTISEGVSDTTQTSPAQTVGCFGLTNQGGPLNFNGTSSSTPQTATFAVDLTGFISSTPAAQRFYLLVGDTVAGSPTTISTYALLDLVHNKQVACSQVPLSCDNSNISPYVDYNFSGNILPNPPVVAITSPVNNANLTGTVEVTMNATSNIGIAKVALYIDSVLYATDTTSPYIISVDTTKLSNGAHTLYAIAYDTQNNSTKSGSITVQAQNYPASVCVNAGGDAVTYWGVSWLKDFGFTNSGTYSLNLPFQNPVYNSERYGNNFSYTFAVSNGLKKVTLKFAEIYFKAAKQRVFNVAINGKQVVSNLDLYKLVGYGVPYDLSFPVTVTNNSITISFTSIKNNAKISAIKITP